MSGDHKMDANMKNDMKMANGENCPMMKDGKMPTAADGKAHEMHKGMMHSADGTTGCACPCCSKAKEKNDASAI